MERPSAITPELTDAICEHLRAGHYFNTACRLAGVSPGSAGEWLQRGENRHHRPPTQETVAFADAVNTASAEAEANALRVVLAGARSNRGAQWFLERRFQLRWGVRRLNPEVERKAADDLVEIFWSILHDGDLDLAEEQAETLRRLFLEGIRRFGTAQDLGDDLVDAPLEQHEMHG